ncbi:hypothetical protein J1N35_009937 [Gossypium stocksii]|uniref:Uncharacterized protein n=1 Tax=Gossypium stocksii TaxID=47602 RepID=A0A9D4ABD0_9ROSI|nr:hypothetical protein J1N35_009937 [Gossypium stocksii]
MGVCGGWEVRPCRGLKPPSYSAVAAVEEGGFWQEVSVGVRVGWEVRPCLCPKQPLDTAVSAVLGGRVGGEVGSAEVLVYAHTPLIFTPIPDLLSSEVTLQLILSFPQRSGTLPVSAYYQPVEKQGSNDDGEFYN